MHNKDQIHRELKKVSSYVILGDDVMIFNIKSGYDGHTQRFQDLSDLGEFIIDKFSLTIVDRTQFLNCFTNGEQTYSWNYDRFVSMLIDHPTLKSEFSRLKCYFDFHQSKKHKARLNGPCFDTKIKGPDFEEFRNWDTKIVIDGYLDKSKKFTQKEKGEKLNGNSVEDLIQVIRNVYVHYVKDEELDKINEEINTCVPGLLSRIHATLRIKKLKINQAGEVLGGETCRPLESTHWFFDPKKSSEFPVPVPDYIILDGVRYGSPSKLYLLPIPGRDRDMVPDEEWHYLYTFDTETKSLEQIEGPQEFKRSSILISGYGKLYHLTDPASFPLITNPSFECYNPKDIWEPLNPFPKYGQKMGPSYVEFVLLHIAGETWHPGYVPTVDDDMTGTKPYPSFVGRAVVVNDVMYAASTVSGVIISFSLGMDSDPSGRILFTVKNLFKFPEFTSFLELDNTVTESLVHLGELRFCLLQTVFCSRGRGFQPLQFKDFEPEEDNKCQAAVVQWAARRRGKTKENNKFIIQFDEFELSGDKKVQLKLVQQWLARERSKMKEKNSNSKPEVLEPNAGETNKLTKNSNAGETNKLAKNFGSKEEETDKSTEDVIHKEDETGELDKKRAEASRSAAKKKRKRNKKKKLGGRTGARVALLSFLSGLYMGTANLPGLVSRRVMDGLVSRFTSLLPRRVMGWLSA
ncbi:hypothetical protein C1H46_038087 [Malus baccata]|uniref:KEN domain-containing protein n=1 Tax=Malus baccata TaxID=106549 RepID=A0A540KQ91_MALBA|nr:hypothetical protein C1H46_038087 [Malus baccata]